MFLKLKKYRPITIFLSFFVISFMTAAGVQAMSVSSSVNGISKVSISSDNIVAETLCTKNPSSSSCCNTPNPSANNCKIISDLVGVIDFLSAGVGLIVVTMLVIGGIQYIASGDNPKSVDAAKKRIANALLALVAFIFLFALLQWLVPGGLFS